MKNTLIFYSFLLLANISFSQKTKIVKAVTKVAIKNASKAGVKNAAKSSTTIFFVSTLKSSKKYLSPEDSKRFLERTFSKQKAERIFNKLGNKKINEIYNLIPADANPQLKKNFIHDMSSDDAFLKLISEKPNLLNCCYNKLISTGPSIRRNPEFLMDIMNGKKPLVLKTLNSENKGKTINGVYFRAKKILLDGGLEVEVVVPDFKKFAIFSLKIPENLILKSDRKQMTYAFMKFRKNLLTNPELQKKFTKEQLEEIMTRKLSLSSNTHSIPGYVWHHTEDKGFQLVERNIHDITSHTGGRALYGGGSTLR